MGAGSSKNAKFSDVESKGWCFRKNEQNIFHCQASSLDFNINQFNKLSNSSFVKNCGSQVSSISSLNDSNFKHSSFHKPNNTTINLPYIPANYFFQNSKQNSSCDKFFFANNTSTFSSSSTKLENGETCERLSLDALSIDNNNSIQSTLSSFSLFATQDYTANFPEELSIKKGEVLHLANSTPLCKHSSFEKLLTSSFSKDWLKVKNGRGVIGWVPITCTNACEQNMLTSTQSNSFKSKTTAHHHNHHHPSKGSMNFNNNNQNFGANNTSSSSRDLYEMSDEDHYSTLPWFHGNISRTKAELLLNSGITGSFLVRQSESCPGQFSISVRREDRVYHYRISKLELRNHIHYCVVPEKRFATLHELIHYHSISSCGLVCQLLYPASKTSNRSMSQMDLHKSFLSPTHTNLHANLFKSSVKSHATTTPAAFTDVWEVDRSELVLKKKLGVGQYGEVYQAFWSKHKQVVAIKTLKQEGTMPLKEFLEEASIMKELKHPNLVRLLGVCTQDAPYFIITEFMSEGNLLDYLQKNSSEIPISTLFYMSLQIASAMTYLESRNFIHRDLAARNCLVETSCVVKVADFGLARLIGEDMYTAAVGAKFPIKWTAPEGLAYNTFSTKSDVWGLVIVPKGSGSTSLLQHLRHFILMVGRGKQAQCRIEFKGLSYESTTQPTIPSSLLHLTNKTFGVLLWELATYGNAPYAGVELNQVYPLLEKGYRMHCPPECPGRVYELMLSCWMWDACKRPTFQVLYNELELLFHKFSHEEDLESISERTSTSNQEKTDCQDDDCFKHESLQNGDERFHTFLSHANKNKLPVPSSNFPQEDTKQSGTNLSTFLSTPPSPLSSSSSNSSPSSPNSFPSPHFKNKSLHRKHKKCKEPVPMNLPQDLNPQSPDSVSPISTSSSLTSNLPPNILLSSPLTKAFTMNSIHQHQSFLQRDQMCNISINNSYSKKSNMINGVNTSVFAATLPKHSLSSVNSSNGVGVKIQIATSQPNRDFNAKPLSCSSEVTVASNDKKVPINSTNTLPSSLSRKECNIFGNGMHNDDSSSGGSIQQLKPNNLNTKNTTKANIPSSPLKSSLANSDTQQLYDVEAKSPNFESNASNHFSKKPLTVNSLLNNKHFLHHHHQNSHSSDQSRSNKLPLSFIPPPPPLNQKNLLSDKKSIDARDVVSRICALTLDTNTDDSTIFSKENLIKVLDAFLLDIQILSNCQNSIINSHDTLPFKDHSNQGGIGFTLISSTKEINSQLKMIHLVLEKCFAAIAPLHCRFKCREILSNILTNHISIYSSKKSSSSASSIKDSLDQISNQLHKLREIIEKTAQ